MIRTLKAMPPTAMLGILVIAIYALTAILAPLLAPYGQAQIVGQQFEPWGATYPLGTDALGRDMLSRLLWGTRLSLAVGFAAAIVAATIGAAIGIISSQTRST